MPVGLMKGWLSKYLVCIEKLEGGLNSCMIPIEQIHGQSILYSNPIGLINIKSINNLVSTWLPGRELTSCMVIIRQSGGYPATCQLTLSLEDG